VVKPQIARLENPAVALKT